MNKIIKFEASWCQPCKRLTKELAGFTFPIEVVNIDDNQIATDIYRIKGVPTLIFIKDDIEIDRVVGFVTKEKVAGFIDKIYSKP
ncbi:thioredoxin TrxA [soil metagenome]